MGAVCLVALVATRELQTAVVSSRCSIGMMKTVVALL
jgi:hypothetical protein